MPIKLSELEKMPQTEKDHQTEKVLRFLGENKEKAYTSSELARLLKIKRGYIGNLLSVLKWQNKINHKKPYWYWR